MADLNVENSKISELIREFNKSEDVWKVFVLALDYLAAKQKAFEETIGQVAGESAADEISESTALSEFLDKCASIASVAREPAIQILTAANRVINPLGAGDFINFVSTYEKCLENYPDVDSDGFKRCMGWKD